MEQDEKSLRATIKKLAGELAKHRINLILGGRFSHACLPRSMPNVMLVASMSDLAATGRGMLNS